MATVTVYNQKGEKVKERELADAVFAVPVNEALVHQAAVTQMANERQVLAHTKTRSEVRGGGRKPWRQKGTGRARAGSTRSPIWTGGGVTFGPRNDRNFSKKINGKMKKKALLMVLSDKVAHQALAIVDSWSFDEVKTKYGNAAVTAFEAVTGRDAKKDKRSTLVVTPADDQETARAFRNLAGVKVINESNVNIIDLLTYKTVIATEATIDRLETRYKK